MGCSSTLKGWKWNGPCCHFQEQLLLIFNNIFFFFLILMQFLITCCLELVGERKHEQLNRPLHSPNPESRLRSKVLGKKTKQNKTKQNKKQNKQTKKQCRNKDPQRGRTMEQSPDLTRFMLWPLQRITTSSLLQQLQRHIKKRNNKKGTNLPTGPQKRQDKDNDKDRTRQDIFTNTIKIMKTKATHAQRGLPHTSIHSHSNTDLVQAHTTLTHLQAQKNNNYVPTYGLY